LKEWLFSLLFEFYTPHFEACRFFICPPQNSSLLLLFVVIPHPRAPLWLLMGCREALSFFLFFHWIAASRHWKLFINV
jgi:hypothetical protein